MNKKMILPTVMIYAHSKEQCPSYKNDLYDQERLNRDKYIPCIVFFLNICHSST